MDFEYIYMRNTNLAESIEAFEIQLKEIVQTRIFDENGIHLRRVIELYKK